MTLPKFSTQWRSVAPSPELAEGTDSDAYLFETPADLLCPITHELFHEPAINAAGQVYERAAIEKALAHRLVDPISNLSLSTAALTTVWPMKSKAAAYRERALRGCVERLCHPSYRSPFRYLRRAAELSAGMAPGADASGAVLGLPGLTPGVVQYLLTHPSSIYDFQALSRYAASLAAAGDRDLAAGVYTKLLHLGGDSQQQVEALQGLLACWGGGEEEEDEQRLVEKLAALSCGEGPAGCRPARFVGVLLEAGLHEKLVLRFCEYIIGGNRMTHGSVTPSVVGCGGPTLSRVSSSTQEKGGAAGKFGGGTPTGPCTCPGTSGYSELMFVYTRLRCGRLEAALAQLQAGTGTSAESCSGSDRGPGGGSMAEGTVRVNDGGFGKRRPGWGKARRHKLQRALCMAVFALSSLLGPSQPLARAAQVASALLLMNRPLRQGDG